jgi:hypothetical protein
MEQKARAFAAGSVRRSGGAVAAVLMTRPSRSAAVSDTKAAAAAAPSPAHAGISEQMRPAPRPHHIMNTTRGAARTEAAIPMSRSSPNSAMSTGDTASWAPSEAATALARKGGMKGARANSKRGAAATSPAIAR